MKFTPRLRTALVAAPLCLFTCSSCFFLAAQAIKKGKERSERREQWQPGLPHPIFAGLESADLFDHYVPSAGSWWLDTYGTEPRLVVWGPGYTHAQVPGLRSTSTQGFWEPTPGNTWNDTGTAEPRPFH